MKKVISLIVAICLMAAIAVPGFAVSGYVDTVNHWAKAPVDRWSEYGIVNGVGYNKFAPDDTMSRQQVAAVFARLLKLANKADLGAFTDMDKCALADEVAKCVAAGIMKGTSTTTMNPDGVETREQLFTMFARAMGFVPQDTCKNSFEDYAEVSASVRGLVNALINLDYVHGMSATELAPKDLITRAQVMALLDKTISTYVTKDGATVEAKGNGVTLIVADNVTVVGSSNDALIVVAKENANVSLKGYKGVPTINVVADKVVIKDAPAKTVINTTENTTATVNGYQISKDNQYIVPETPAVSGGSSSGGSSGGSSCKHQDTSTAYSMKAKVITCKDCPETVDTYPAVACTTLSDASGADYHAYTAVYSDGSFYAFADAERTNLTELTVKSWTTGEQFEIDGVEINNEIPERSFEKTVNTKLNSADATTYKWNTLVVVPDEFATTVVLNLTSDTHPAEVTVAYNVTRDTSVDEADGIALIGAFDKNAKSADIQTVLDELLANKHDMGDTQSADSVTVEKAWANDRSASYTLNDPHTFNRNSSRREVFDNVTQDDTAGGEVAGGAGMITVNAKGKQYVSYGFDVETNVSTNLMTLIWNFAQKEDLGGEAMSKREFMAAARDEVTRLISSVNGEKLVIDLYLLNEDK